MILRSFLGECLFRSEFFVMLHNTVEKSGFISKILEL